MEIHLKKSYVYWLQINKYPNQHWLEQIINYFGSVITSDGNTFQDVAC